MLCSTVGTGWRDWLLLVLFVVRTLRQVLAELALDPVVGPLWATKGFGFFEMMFKRFEHGEKVWRPRLN